MARFWEDLLTRRHAGLPCRPAKALRPRRALQRHDVGDRADPRDHAQLKIDHPLHAPAIEEKLAVSA